MNTNKEKKNKAKMFAIVTAMLMLAGGLVFLVPADESDADPTPVGYDLSGCGINANGQQGSGDTTDVTAFTVRASNVVSVAVSNSAIWYIDTNGDLYGCGSDQYGQQGNGSVTGDVTTFTKRASNVVSVKTGGDTTWYLDTNGDLYGCGRNNHGQQGVNNSSTDVTTFTKRASNVKDFDCSENTTWYITNSGAIYGCGYGQYGQQSIGSSTASDVTTFTSRYSQNVTSVSAASHDTWFIESNTLYGCGRNQNGQQGSGDTTDKYTFAVRANNVSSVFASDSTTWYIDTNGDLYGCGGGSFGQQGSGDTTSVTTFTKRASNVVSMVNGTYTTWYIDTNGDLYGCGRNQNGQQGSGDTTDVTTFTKRASNVVSVAASSSTTWYIDTNGDLYGCGRNNNGQQGSGDTTDVTTFTKRGSGVVNVVASSSTTWLLKTSSAAATIESNNTSYGTVSTASITDIEPGTAVTISQDGLTLTIGAFGSSVATPTVSDAQYTYALSGWYVDNVALQTGDTIDSDVTIEARFTQTLNDYTVTIARNNTNWGTVSESSVTVPYGTSISAASNVLTIGSNNITATAASATAQYTYAFDSWTGASGTVTADKTITANFERTVNQYTVSVTEVDPANIGSFNVMSYTADYGTSVTFTDSSILFGGVARITETHSGSDAQYTNTFAWSPNLPFTLTQNVQVTGTFTQTVNQYTVTIQSNDNSYGTVSPGSVTVDYGTAITVSGNSLTIGSQAITATPAASDAHWTYAFAGWDTASSTVTGNKTITGTFTRTLTPHTVSIASNDTTYGLVAPATVSNVPYGTVITVSSNTMDVNGTTVTATPNAATQSQRFSFNNWTVGGTAVGSTYTVTDDVSIVGNFTVGPNVYTVTIVAGENGTVSQASIADVPYGTAISSSGNVVTVGAVQVTATPDQATDKYTYSFGSWTNGTGTVSDDMTITANFTATVNEYTVTIQPNNADYGTVSPTTVLNVPYDTVIAVDGDEITIDGTTVTATPNEQTVQYVFSFGSWTLPTGSKTGTNTVITANFIATLREYTVTWVIQADSQDQTYQYGQTPSHAAPQVPGYSFGGWTPEIVSVTGDATYTATLTPITYTITWNANGGTVDPATSQGTVEDSIELPVPEREFYDFDGWFTSAQGGIQIAGPLHPTSNATYYAHWTMRTYTVTFDGSGGTPGTASSDGSEIMAVTMPGAELTGKFLKGWFTSAEGGDRIGLEGSMYYPSEDITLYAQWSDTQVYDYIVNFDGKGGWDVPSALLAQNSSEGTYTFTLPMNVPENTEGNNFLGWSTSPEAVTVDVEPGQSVIVNSDEPRTLYAVWSDSQPDNPFGFIMKTVPILVGVGLLIGVVSMFITNRMSAADLAKAIAAIAVGVILLVFVLIPISGGF